jgi:hypothetical protein
MLLEWIRITSDGSARGDTLIHLMMSEGSYLKVWDAATAKIEGERLVCRDRDGQTIAHFARLRVMLFSPSSHAGELMAEASEEIRALDSNRPASLDLAMVFLRRARSIASEQLTNAGHSLETASHAIEEAASHVLEPESRGVPHF